MPRICILSSVHQALDNRIFYREAQSLRQAGYEVTLIAVNDRNETKDGVAIIGLPSVQRWQRPILWFRLIHLANHLRADVYHIQDPELLLISPVLKWQTGKPVIYDVHEDYAGFMETKDYVPHWFRRPLSRIVAFSEPKMAQFQNGLIFADDQIANLFQAVKLPKTTLFNFPGQKFIDRAIETKNNNGANSHTVLHLGGHKRGRGIFLMLEAFQKVHEELPQARLLLVGPFQPNELEQTIRKEVNDRGLAEVIRITGPVRFEEVGEFYRQASVGWIPWEPVAKNQKNVPTKLFEYMAYGLPVVSSDLQSVRQFLDQDKTGLLVPAADPDAHSQAIITLLKNPEVARSMGHEGQRKVQAQYNWNSMEERLLRLYDQVLGAKDVASLPED